MRTGSSAQAIYQNGLRDKYKAQSLKMHLKWIAKCGGHAGPLTF